MTRLPPSGPGPLRFYAPDECGADGYPLAWHSIDGGPGVKHLVRAAAGHRCIRCQHPYGGDAKGEWTPCDALCTHAGPIRSRRSEDEGWFDAPVVYSGIPAALVRNGTSVDARWRILTVHHLQHGHDAKRDLRWWNLAALCQRCHLTIQGRVQMARVWPWPHTDWFKPYAAGWYAWSYLGEDLSRAEVMERLDDLLALELVA